MSKAVPSVDHLIDVDIQRYEVLSPRGYQAILGNFENNWFTEWNIQIVAVQEISRPFRHMDI